MLSKPVVGIANSASGFNNCHRHFPEVLEAVKRGPTPVVATPAPTETPSPSPIPPTDTPSPTPTLAPTATPFPMFFTDEFDSLSAAWTTMQAGSDAAPNITAESSRLSIQTDAPYAWVYSSYSPQEYGDVRLDAKFMNNALSPASAGLICRYSETDGWLEYNVTSDGSYNLLYGKWLASGVADYLPIVDGVSNAVPQSGMELQIGIQCSGTIATLLINDTDIRNADVSRFELAAGNRMRGSHAVLEAIFDAAYARRPAS